jgi:uncharacterized membrane protein YfcA
VTPLHALELLAIGFSASIFGSLIGLGGGFVVIPVMRLAFNTPPALLAGTSLVFVFANTGASAFGYIRQKRVDFALAAPLIIGAIPGSVFGAIAVHWFSPQGFDYAYGTTLVILAALVLWRRKGSERKPFERTFAHRWPVAIAAGVLVGIFSSLFGIGAGLVLVPLLLVAARMPPHIVAATSGFTILCTSPVGILAQALTHDVDWISAVPLVIGGIAGGSIAPAISRRVSSPQLITLLAIGLILAAVGLAAKHFANSSGLTR